MDHDGHWKLSALKSAALAKPDEWVITAVRCGGYLLLGFVLSCARVLQVGAPFGMAMVACAGAGLGGVFALAGAALGYLISGGIEWGIRYIAAAVLVYTVSFVFQELRVYAREYFMPAVSALVMALTGFLGSFSASAGSIPLFAELFLEACLAFGGCYFFAEALRSELRTTETQELKHTVSLVITAGCVMMAFSRIVLFHTVSVGRFLALLIVMTCAMKGGMLAGAASGTVLGLAMDIAAGGVPFYTMAYSFSGLLSGVFGKHGRLIFVLSFVLSDALAVVCAWNSADPLSALFETFCASVIFMLIPASILNQAGMLLEYSGRGSGETGLRRYVSSRVQSLGSAYGELYDTVRRNIAEPYNDENIARVYDRAADEVCVHCKHKNRCWNAEYVDTLSAMNDATRAMTENGTLSVEDIPEFFRLKCESMPAFVAAVNGELRSLAYRRQLRSKLSESRSVAWEQYLEVSQILSRVAEELGSVNGADHLAERRLMRYLKSLDVDADIAVYRDGGGRLRVTIESGRLTPLTSSEDYLQKLSGVVGVRLCAPREGAESTSRLTLLEAEPYAVSVGIAALKKRGETVSGDKGTYFKTDAGVLCVILSDGMGCGDSAARESGEVIRILEKFLRAGVDPANAMRILNSVMLLRSGDSWGFATVDLMCVDLFTGETCFYKFGAAPSYVKNGRSIRRIKGETLAVGLSTGEGTAPDIVRMKLRPGSTALIASDGVISDTDDAWIKDLMSRSTEDMKALARSALKEAERLYGAGDDMTVVTLRVEERV